MKVTAIIAEYNPLHNGHAMHIKTAREETKADHIIAVMSGSFVQRGAPAIVSKYERASSALRAGADLVIELPVCFSTGSLEYFAKGAVSLIAGTGIADCISFGSECGDIGVLKEAASVISDHNGHNDPVIRNKLANGCNYAAALNTSEDINPRIKEVLRTPNNLLAASYISASEKLAFDCAFHTLKREGAAYHDDTKGALSSSALRREILSGTTVSDDRIPDEISAALNEYLNNYPPLSENDLSLLLFSKIHDIVRKAVLSGSDPASVLNTYLDVSESLACKIIKTYKHASSWSDLCERLKSKDMVYSRISRALTHILLDIKKQNMAEYEGSAQYIKPLAFKRTSSPLLHELKEHAALPVISKNADAGKILEGRALRMFNENIFACELYEKTACTMYKRPFISEYERSAVII